MITKLLKKYQLQLGVFIIAGYICVLLINTFIVFSTQKYIFKINQPIAAKQTAVVFGAGLTNGSPSKFLEERLNTAIALYQQHKVQFILLSGDDGRIATNEITPMYQYCLAHQIPAKQILIDNNGKNTYTTLQNARQIFGQKSLILCTQKYHLPRAIFIANHIGLQAIGIDASTYKTNQYSQQQQREYLATIKAIWDTFMGNSVS